MHTVCTSLPTITGIRKPSNLVCCLGILWFPWTLGVGFGSSSCYSEYPQHDAFIDITDNTDNKKKKNRHNESMVSLIVIIISIMMRFSFLSLIVYMFTSVSTADGGAEKR